MKVKIDTKEKFHVLTLQENYLPANMTDDLKNLLLPYLTAEIKNVVVNMKEVSKIDELCARSLVTMQQKFYDDNASFVLCELQTEPERYFDCMELLEVMNVTPTESEAWDIIQLEEIERELL